MSRLAEIVKGAAKKPRDFKREAEEEAHRRIRRLGQMLKNREINYDSYRTQSKWIYDELESGEIEKALKNPPKRTPRPPRRRKSGDDPYDEAEETRRALAELHSGPRGRRLY